MTNYANAFRVKQALGKAGFNVSNYFPLVGETVTLLNESTDEDNNTWTIKDGVNADESSTLVNENVTILAEDGSLQKLDITNTVSTDSHEEIVYGLTPPNDTYYDIVASTPISRINAVNRITIVSKYGQSDAHVVSVEVINADTGVSYLLESNVVDFIDVTFTESAAYNIKVISNASGSITERILYRAITIVPLLEPIANAYEFTLENTIDSLSVYGTPFNSLNGDNVTIAPGRTIVLQPNQNGYSEDARYRISFENLIGTAQQPIIITVEDSVTLQYDSFYGINFVNCQHVILDGMGYSDTLNSLHVTKHPDSEQGDSCVSFGTLSNYIQVYGVEFSFCSFSGLVIKTDPDKNNPATWDENFRMYDTILHNCYFHDTRAEGIYFGYFGADVKSATNSSGVPVTYRAHKLQDTKIYRNSFIQCGWDALQFNNGAGLCEVHDNYIKDAAFFGEPDQNTGISMSMVGKVFNNVVDGVKGLGMQIGALGPLDIYNNIFTNLAEGARGIFLLSDSDVPEQNVNGATNQIPINIYNNNIFTTGMGSTIGAQNVIQYLNLVFKNNIYSAQNKFSGQSSTTISLWETNQSNNVQIDMDNLSQYKIGSVTKAVFDIYPSSTLASGGALVGDQYDSRGFKNWSDGDKFVGARAGVIRMSNSILSLETVIINNGEDTTAEATVSVEISFIGNPTQYRISESATFVGASWETYTSTTIPFTVTNQGDITIYVELRNNTVESTVISDSIEYTSNKQYLVSLQPNLSYTNTFLPNWNIFEANSAFPVPQGYSSDFLFEQGDASVSTLKLVVDLPFDSSDSNRDETDPFPYPEFAVRFNWKVLSTNPNNAGSFQLIGCDDTKLYDIVLYARREYAGKPMIFEVNQVQQPFNPADLNLNNQVVFSDVASLSGVIDISAVAISDGAWIGLLDITEKPGQQGDNDNDDTTLQYLTPTTFPNI
jgi:hypothetical protein